jgi:hypothetical protein
MANAAEAELASKETLLKGDAGSVKEQLLTALDIKYGSMIRRLEVAVKEATAARQMAHEAREDIESRAQEAGKDVGALRDAADEADALAQQAMELAEVAVQDAVQAQEEMKLAQTALNEALASIQETASSLAAKQEEAEMEVAAEQEAAAAAAAAAGTAESATPPPAPSAPAPTGGPLELETLDDSVDQGGFVSPRPLSPSKAASVEVDKVLQVSALSILNSPGHFWFFGFCRFQWDPRVESTRERSRWLRKCGTSRGGNWAYAGGGERAGFGGGGDSVHGGEAAAQLREGSNRPCGGSPVADAGQDGGGQGGGGEARGAQKPEPTRELH